MEETRAIRRRRPAVAWGTGHVTSEHDEKKTAHRGPW